MIKRAIESVTCKSKRRKAQEANERLDSPTSQGDSSYSPNLESYSSEAPSTYKASHHRPLTEPDPGFGSRAYHQGVFENHFDQAQMKATRDKVPSGWFNYKSQEELSERLLELHQISYAKGERGGLGTESGLACLEVETTITLSSVVVRCDSTFADGEKDMETVEVVLCRPAKD